MSDESTIGINFNDVIDLNVRELGVIYRDPKGKLGVSMMRLNSKDFKLFKFEAIRWIKKKPNPDDRAWPFELENEHGCYDYEKEQKIISQRKTRQEKEDEKQEDQYWKEKHREHGLDL